jgi:hypothetical protein
VQADVTGVRNRAEVKQKSFSAMLLWVAVAAALYFGTQWLFSGRTLSYYHLECFVALFVVWNGTLDPAQEWYAAQIEHSAYKRDSKFIPNARVSDPLPEQLNRETVEKRNPHGDAQFATPEEASSGLAG